MTRRKQTQPLHIDTVNQIASLLEYGSHSEAQGDDCASGDEHICGKCRLEFVDLSDFLHHKRQCTRKRLVLVVGDDSSDDLGVEGRSTSSLDFTDDPEKFGREVPTTYMGSSSYDKPDSPDSADLPTLLVGKTIQSYVGTDDRPLEIEGLPKGDTSLITTNGSYTNNIKRDGADGTVASLPPSLPQYIYTQPVPDTNVTLQALQNTRVAVAQQGASANNVPHLAALHSALYTLQQQQIIQLQVIQQLQTQLVGSTNSTNPLVPVAPPLGTLTGTVALTPPQSTDGNTGGVLALTTSTPSLTAADSVPAQNLTTTSTATAVTSRSTSAVTEGNGGVLQPLPPPPPPHEPNTLELLQRHTEQALQNTMAGSSFLLNGLSGLGNGSDILRFCKSKSGSDGKRDGSEEAFFRHRCRFCGKVFGSDSALQIHIRSHTGERPFKCNVCGNRFSTKGNLKVHFQRHKAKYPHIKMNPHPVPLHMDSLHPPLEPPEASETPPIAGSASSSQTIAHTLPPSTMVPSQPLPLVTHAIKGRETPSDLTTQPASSEEQGTHLQPRSVSPNETSNLTDASEGSVGEGYGSDDNGLKDGDPSRYDEDMMDHEDDSFSSSPKQEQKDGDDNMDDESKPLTSENGALMHSVPSIPTYISTAAPTFPSFFHPSFSPSFSMAPMCFPPMSTPPLTSTPSSRPGVTTANSSISNNDGNEQVGPSPDPNFYQDLLPKPGSNDNSWESLMEVTKTSETSKLQQLVDNIEHKLSDPNQCVICHRVLSCKSALQMHYRTHTGERPFKCKICGRAFTTKGNLKTHMGVHRVKPPLRVLHQCPVCHKQFTNSLVLQQHIRMHTGEPTDMLPEQIMANEVKPNPLLPTSFQRPMLPALLPHLSPVLPPRSSPIALPASCPTPKASEALSLTPSPVHSATPTESVIKTTSKSKDTIAVVEEVSSPPTPANSSRPPSVRTDHCPTPQPVASNASPITITATTASAIATTATIIASTRSASPSMDRPIVTTAPYSPSYTASLVALENHVKAINTSIPQPLPFSPFGMGLAMGGYLRYEDTAFLSRNQPKDMSINRDKSPAPFPSYSPSPNTSRGGSDGSADERSTPGSMIKSESPVSVNGSTPLTPSGVITTKSETGALDLTPKNSVLSMSPSVADMKLFPSPLAGLPFPATPGRLTTTCRICFKTFACNSALEIHYRSHTKERPFKCNVCDRGFSTKGNMKQHMLTHKIRDLPPQLFTATTESSTATTDSETNSMTNQSPCVSSPTHPTSESSVVQNLINNESRETSTSATTVETTIITSTMPTITSTMPTIASTMPTIASTMPTITPTIKNAKSEAEVKRSHSDSSAGTPLPKRLPSSLKHFCHICQKPFSSASALQIHNRTHTGDKPFKCTICGRAFTTKGNLKVHMGTHMWNNGTSRRGRRMSLELPPLPLPPHGKPDFHHPRPDLYFPYLPPGYMNGMTVAPPKMNEISVIQTAAGVTNGTITTPSSMTLTPAVSMMTPGMTVGQQQPFVRNQAPPNTDSDGGEDVDARSPDEAENLKIQQSPPRPPESGSPLHHTMSPPSVGERSATWGWKIACNVCSKICSSSADLEIHLKSHCNPAVQDTVRSTPQTAEHIAS